ncbi:MAG: hypothetical protein ACI4ND_04275 [Succinivibrio sp.]
MNKSIKTIFNLTVAGALLFLSNQAVARPAPYHHFYDVPMADHHYHHKPPRHHRPRYHLPPHHDFEHFTHAKRPHENTTEVIIVKKRSYHHAPPPHPNMHGGPLFDVLAAAEHLARAVER